MPELPEVETIRRGLVPRLVGRRIVAVEDAGSKLRLGPSPRPLGELEGQTVLSLDRHGKFLMAALNAGTLVIHLGMTGKLLFADDGQRPLPHTHLSLEMDDGTILRFSDPRRFGSLRLLAAGSRPPELSHYGLDALDPAFTTAHLAMLLRKSRAPLKSFLLDQTKVAGVGNIYACEALWQARLSPRRLACNTPKAKMGPLREAIVEVLQASLAAGGTSFNDYVDSIGQKGSFLFAVAVFQREGSACPRCSSLVRRIVQSGRSTFYCPACQR